MIYQITTITDDAAQSLPLILPDGSSMVMNIRYSPTNQGWFIDSLTWNSFVLNGTRITNSPNMLRQFQNQLTFGLACITVGNREPSQQEDFLSGASTLYILDSTSVAEYEAILSGG